MKNIFLILIILQISLYAELIKRNSIVVDTEYLLMWQDDTEAGEKQLVYSAKEYCEKLELDNHSTWRIPTRIELLTIYNIIFPDKLTGAFSEIFHSGKIKLKLKKVFKYKSGDFDDYILTINQPTSVGAFDYDEEGRLAINTDDIKKKKTIRCVKTQ